MKNLIIALLIITATFFSSAVTRANAKEVNEVDFTIFNNTLTELLHQHTLKLQSISEANQNKKLAHFVENLNKFDKTKSNHSPLKSATIKKHKLDSLQVDRWNDKTGQLEPSQLERWLWNEKGESESWELYDIDTLTNEWIPNDKEVYAWDENGNKTIHMDYNPDSLSGTWKKNAVEYYNYNSNGDMLELLIQYWDNDIADWANDWKETQEYSEFGPTAITDFEWNATEEVWDTTAFVKVEHNTTGDIIFQEFYFPISPDYIMHDRFVFSYDSLGNQTQYISYTWDDTSKQFISTLKNTNEFDVNGNKTAWRQFLWNTASNKWEEQWCINYQYDSLGFRVYRDRYNRIDSTGVFAPTWKNEYTNSTSGKLLEKINYVWVAQDSIWLEDYQINYEYSVNGEISFEDYLNWDTTLTQWTNSYKKNYLYNTSGKLLHEDRYNWDSAADAWIGEYQENYSFNTNGELLHEDRYNYDSISNEWIGEYQENYDYDASGNYLGEEKLVWDTLANDWGSLYNYDFTYDLSVSFSGIAFPIDFVYGHLSNIAIQDQYANKMLIRNYSEHKNGQLEITEKTSLFYSEINITGIIEQAKNTLCVYPNPASSFIAFKGLNTSSEVVLSLYNLQGEKMLSTKLNAENKVNINHLKSGIYIYELANETEVFRGKISKK